ncbi:MAG: hypothetical protein M1816_006007 [Peltula sp. TS41687]|nr:MAG: hypothetical protein M1816_006007 [Peltula sp. TS41687]
MRVLHLTIGLFAIHIATAVALPAQPSQGYKARNAETNERDPSSADNTETALNLAVLVGGAGAAWYGLRSSPDDRDPPSAGDAKRYNKDTWKPSKQKFVEFCKLHEITRQQREKKRPLTEAEKLKIERSWADEFDRLTAGSSALPNDTPDTQPQPPVKETKKEQKKKSRLSRITFSIIPALDRIKNLAGSTINHVNQDHVGGGLGGLQPFNAGLPVFQGVY